MGDLEAPEQVPVYEALRRVMAGVGVIGKGSRMKDSGGYNYRSIEEVMPRTTPLLVEHGVVVTPEVLDVDIATHFNEKEYHHRYRVRWTFHGPAGDSIQAVTVGEALDTRDKGANKAMTASLKQALTTVFQIAVKGAFDDPDHYGKDADGAKPVNAAWVKNGLLARAQELGWPDPIEAATGVWRRAGWDGNAFDKHAAETLIATMPEPEPVESMEGGMVVGSGSEVPSTPPAKEPDPAMPAEAKSARRRKIEKLCDEYGIAYTDESVLSELVNACTEAAAAAADKQKGRDCGGS